MTLTLILTRHAKSDWDDPALDDYDRPLNARGRRSAAAIGSWLVAQDLQPDVVLLSGARRTVETWEGMASRFPETSVETVGKLYLGNAAAILSALRAQSAPTVMVICHNPGIADFARRMARTPPDHPRFGDYPTAATTVMRFDVQTWQEIDWSSAAAAAFTVPRDLSEA
ncbi:histidine phosphatase family protein [Alphaproteobacteria bacterium GH1-50]|uniref:Histidine phosphatase family protein n=1 Tax=Kangsaoukella pontilimi TaxID=2691042 RepID=A0A7C9MTK8_9RHOB|nr:histidine phosphatase family protein [Kangsaoukella pontilimi]MXQ06260.1 histidine phosphatase family protein [Kangsaoukella pontilimi]